jgi:hypothetical protein
MILWTELSGPLRSPSVPFGPLRSPSGLPNSGSRVRGPRRGYTLPIPCALFPDYILTVYVLCTMYYVLQYTVHTVRNCNHKEGTRDRKSVSAASPADSLTGAPPKTPRCTNTTKHISSLHNSQSCEIRLKSFRHFERQAGRADTRDIAHLMQMLMQSASTVSSFQRRRCCETSQALSDYTTRALD